MSNVRLIGVTRPVIDEVPDSSSLLAFCARVSSTANQLNHETGGKLIRSLIRRKEWSPLEMVSLTMEIETTRDIARQILRHRSLSFQEFSQRYSIVSDEAIFREARLQDTKDRQNSIEIDDATLAKEWEGLQELVYDTCQLVYRKALEKGLAKEVARAVLPEGMTLSRLYAQGSLRSWLHYVILRADRKTQKEHRLIAEQCRDVIITEFPDLADVFNGDQE